MFSSRAAFGVLAAFALSVGTLPTAPAAAVAADAAPAIAAQPQRSQEPLTVVTAQGRSTLHVEVVDDAAGRQRGLMGRTSLAPDAGMLFDYRRPTQATMWMKDTPLSLDMIFIGEDGRVVRVAEHTQPFSEALIPSFVEVRAVLEVAAGTARRLGIVPDSRIEYPIFAIGAPVASPR